jgi:hypothetical protein
MKTYHPLVNGSAEGEALCREREGVPRLLLFIAGRRPVNKIMSGRQEPPLDNLTKLTIL